MLEFADELMDGMDKNTYNDIAINNMKVFKNNLIKRIEKYNSYIKHEIEKKYTENKTKSNTENNTKSDTENNTEPITKIDDKKKNTKPDTKVDKDLATIDEIKKHIIDKQKIIKKRYKSILETKKTIKNNIDLIYNAFKKLPNESQPKLIKLVRLDTILNDSINVIWHEIYDRNRKVFKKIDINKIKNIDIFIHKLNIVINNKKQLLKTLIIIKLNCIISDIKTKSKIDNVYNFNDKDKLFVINDDLDKYIKILKKYLGNIKQDLKAISIIQDESHKDLMKCLKKKNI